MNSPTTTPTPIPVCRALTRRLTVFGLPYEAFYLGFVVAALMVMWGLYALICLVVLALFIIRKAFLVDEWALGMWLFHARDVARRRTYWEA